VANIRLKVGIAIARFVSRTSKFIGNKGETLPGRILLAIEPEAISLLARDKEVILISGTNGKTSTTKAVAMIISQLGPVATSGSGSNLAWGATSALVSDAPYAVLEIDELHLPSIIAQTDPTVVLLLNLTRDQLHRMYEVKRVADRWHVECTEAVDTVFIADIDDPFINYSIVNAVNVVRVSFGGRRHPDGAVCPRCGGYLTWVGGKYSCACGLTNKICEAKFKPGSASYRNAILANLVGEVVGADPIEFTESQLERSVVREIRGKKVNFRLTKNPASWNEALSAVLHQDVILVLNARQVDGIDTSWLWDVSFAALNGHRVVVCGERALDMAYRIHVEGIESLVVTDFDEALAQVHGSEVSVLAAYTAFFELAM
jgi:UDP-N-acetylmuramyl tripeptide synthase